ncbi:MAG TPA: hypothetical protein V6D30_07825 [Leptolyngbyaceae cyanobacterium]
MQIRFLGKLSLFLVFLTFPSFLALPSSKSILCPLFAWSAQASDFGHNGRDGFNGQAGRKGRDGESQTIFADGSPVNLDLSGKDGEDGEDGRDGSDANCGSQPRDVNRDLRAPDGGGGGNGGNGGNGGDGGSLSVYYTNLADLKKISVRTAGGRGGRSGRRAYGGEGCRCQERRWERQTCTGTPGSPDYRCTTRKFDCEDGKDGTDGTDGRDGSDGQLGSLTLINRSEPLAPDKPTATVSMPELKDRVFALSKNKWETHNGAASLLAPGSMIADQYREFIERIESSFQLVWNAERSLSDFNGQDVTISLEDDKQVKVSFPEDVWVDGTTSQQNGVTQFVASAVILKSEATQLKRSDFSGNGPDLNFVLIDAARKSNLVSTQFRIKYSSTRSGDRFDRDYDYRTRYEGNIPAELVSRDNNRFTLNLGKLPIESQFLRPGVAIKIDLVATRSFAGNSTEQKIQWKGEIRR